MFGRLYGLPILLVVCAALAVTPSSVAAHGLVDQGFTGPFAILAAGGGTGDGQSFTPTKSNIVAADFFLATAAPLAAQRSLTLTVRQTSISGPVLGS
jgi:hypothetical protein